MRYVSLLKTDIEALEFLQSADLLNLGAFGKETFLEAYSVRWSPSRSLCYASVLFELRRHLKGLFPAAVVDGQNKDAKCPASPANTPQASLRTVCFGGGAAEVVGFGGFLRSLHETVLHTSPALQSNQEVTAAAEALENLSLTDEALVIDLLLVDSAQWGDVVRTLHHELTSPPPLSKYASTSAKEANSALIEPRSITAGFRAEDILEMSQSQISEIVGGKQLLVTLLFTLNELYTASIGKTTSFLLNLTTAVSAGSLLLVVDSPGSYSETTIGTEAKKYPMLWLLNHTLLETEKSRGKESMASWSKVVSDESQWFRLHEKLRYPISLENMRYQVHLYRRT